MSSALVETDPFTKVFDALWQMIDQSTTLTSLVKPGNKIRFNLEQNRDPTKENIATADLPELMLTASGVTAANINNTTCSSMIQRQYAWSISSGDFRIQHSLFPVQWGVVCAMLEWDKVLARLTWHDLPFVKVCRVLSLQEGLSIPELNRGIKGWSSIWACSVDMWFKTSEMKTINNA